MPLQQKTEHTVERLMYASRRFLAPIYIGMSLAIAALFVIFVNITAIDNSKLPWFMLIQLTLVFSALFLAFQDKISKH